MLLPFVTNHDPVIATSAYRTRSVTHSVSPRRTRISNPTAARVDSVTASATIATRVHAAGAIRGVASRAALDRATARCAARRDARRRAVAASKHPRVRTERKKRSRAMGTREM